MIYFLALLFYFKVKNKLNIIKLTDLWGNLILQTKVVTGHFISALIDYIHIKSLSQLHKSSNFDKSITFTSLADSGMTHQTIL